MKVKFLLTLVVISLCILENSAQNIVRGPYLQLGTPSSIIVRWRTDTPTTTKLWYGPSPGALTESVDNSAVTTEHEINVTDLTPGTTYYYAVGNASGQMAGADADHYFRTSPVPGSSESFRIWVLGDAGEGDTDQRAVRDAFYNVNGGPHADVILALGDNAYQSGTDAEYQRAWFENMYEASLINSVVWSCVGNHDIIVASSETQTGPYYDIFNFPTGGEAGGVASGTEAWYSFDYGNVHFVCLNSEDVDLSVGGPMLTWLESDLASTDKDWIIAFFHKPPYYSSTTVRTNFLPILEEAGVDLVLYGHNHSYQRSYPMKEHYGGPNSFDAATMIVDWGDGRPNGDGPYQKPAERTPFGGTIYMLTGSAAKVSSVGGEYLFQPFREELLGSVAIDVSGRHMSLQFITSQGNVPDHFMISKGEAASPTVSITSPADGTSYQTPQTITIAADASDPDGQISWVEFYVNGDYIGQDVTAPYTQNWTIPANGTYSLHALTMDNEGNTAQSEAIIIEVGNQSDCSATGDSDNDGVCDDVDVCPDGNDTIDSDSDGTPDDCDACPNSATGDSDNDGVCDDVDVCPGGNDAADKDNDGIPDACDPCNDLEIGSACDDGDPNTNNDVIGPDCVCAGIPDSPNILEVAVSGGSDDVEETEGNGDVYTHSSDLELVNDGTKGNQTIGLRFNNVAVTQSAFITNAYIQFTADETSSSGSNLLVRGEASDDAAPFLVEYYNVSTRTPTNTSVSWTPPSWTTSGQRAANQRTPDLSSIIQEIVNRPGWTEGNSLVFIITGTGTRTAESYEGSPSQAATLHIEYFDGNCPDAGTPCDDGNPTTYNDVQDGNCQCAGTPCPPAGTACDDGNPNTYNDVEDGNCNCAGEPCQDEGTACDDGDPSTYDDRIDANCLCTGTPCPAAGTACDDGDPFTYEDVEDGNCNCTGTPCPAAGTACDDGDPNTYNDVEDGNCNCAGEPCQDEGTACDDGDPSTYDDRIDVNCQCTGTPCPAAGTACDDGNPSTNDDVEDGNCNCTGTPNTPNILEVTIAAGSDDVEETEGTGDMYTHSSDLELVNDGTKGNQTIGLRFNDISIIRGASIANAFIQFTTDETSSINTSLLVQGEAADNASPFSTVSFDVSTRTRTGASVSWNPLAWNSNGQRDIDQRTPNLSAIIQEIVNRPGWNEGNSIVLIITGSGERIAESFEGSPTQAATLHIEYLNGNCPDAGTPCDDGDPATYNDMENGNCQCVGTPCPSAGTACDDGNPNTYNDVEDGNCNCAGEPCQPEGTVCDDGNASTYDDRIDANCQCVGTPCPSAGTACDDGDPSTYDDEEDGNCNCAGTPCPPAGAACDDGNPNTYNDVEDGNCNCTGEPCQPEGTACDDGDPGTIDDVIGPDCICAGIPSAPTILEVAIAAGSDDVEEIESNGDMYTHSSDIELVNDGTKGNQTIGLRFNNINLAPGANITNAYVQFTTDETSGDASNLVVEGEASDNASPFVLEYFDVSNRTRTGASVNWSPPAWNSAGQRASNQRTPDLSTIIQEIVSRPGWTEGNSMVLIITGTGTRTAESYEGSPSQAATLHIEYFPGLATSRITGNLDRDGKEADLPGQWPSGQNPLTVSGEKFRKKTLEVELRPNPFGEAFYLHIKRPAPQTEDAEVQILDISGRSIYRQSNVPLEEDYLITPGDRWPNGVYFVRVQAGEYQKNLRLIKQ